MPQPAAAVTLPQHSLLQQLVRNADCFGLQCHVQPAAQAVAAMVSMMMVMLATPAAAADGVGGGQAGKGSARVQAEGLLQTLRQMHGTALRFHLPLPLVGTCSLALTFVWQDEAAADVCPETVLHHQVWMGLAGWRVRLMLASGQRGASATMQQRMLERSAHRHKLMGLTPSQA